MKTAVCFRNIAMAVLFASVLASCSRDDILSEDRPSGVYTFTLSDDGTKAVLADSERGKYGHWEANDRLGTVVEADKPGYSYVNVGTPSSFKIYRPGGLQAGENLYVYYPYNSSTASAHEARLEIPASQSQSGDEFDFDAMPMAAAPFVITDAQASTTQNTSLGEIYLYNLAAMAEFRIFTSNSSYIGESIQKVRFEAGAPLAGPFTKDITAISEEDESSLEISGYTVSSVETVVSNPPTLHSASDAAAKIYMVLAPGSYSGTVIVTTDKAEYHYPLSSSQTFKRSVVRSLGIDLGTCSDRRSTESFAPVTVTMTITEMLAASGVSSPENGEKYEVLTMDGIIYLETGGAGDNGKYYNNGKNLRIYAGKKKGNVKIKAMLGYELQSVTLNYNLVTGSSGGSTVTPDFDGPASGVPAAVSGTGVVYTVTGDAGSIQITSVSVTYVKSQSIQEVPYLSCTEIPSVQVYTRVSGYETFSDNDGTGRWYAFDTEEPTRKIVTHTFINGGKQYRNYTTMMDQTLRCPLWVAQPMHGVSYKDNNLGRSGKFSEDTSYDPAIPGSWQSSGSTEGGNSGYSRGHLCASADRQVTLASNYQTFYYTNQAPQWQNGFNSGVWSSLEEATQKKAQTLTARDTLYIVSGTLYENEVFGPSNDGGVVARPSHFYKLLMLCSFDGSGTVTAASGAAFVYENKSNSGKYYDAGYKTTIDAIESRAGFDFFASVPSNLQEAAESAFSNIL